MSDLSKRLAGLSPEKQALLEARLKKAQGSRSPASQTIPQVMRAGQAEAFPLSYGQQRLWFLDQLEPGNPFYNEHVGLRFSGQLQVTQLERSLNEIIRRHEILRTSFRTVAGEPAQFIGPFIARPLPLLDLRAVPETERESHARFLAFQEVQRPFDLATGPLIRFELLGLAEAEHILLLTVHHIVADHWSIAIFVKEMCQLYEAFSLGTPSPLPELPIQYVDFSVWQRRQLPGENLETQLAYWKRQLAGVPALLELPVDRPRPAVQTFRGARHFGRLSKTLTEALKTFSRREGVTLFMTLLAAFQALLHRYTGREDIVVGSPMLTRNRVELEGLIGIFLNMLALRLDLSNNPSFRELLRRVQRTALAAYAHPDLPFEKLVDELQPERSLSHSPLFQVVFSPQTVPMPSMELPGLKLNFIKTVDIGVTKFDLEFYMEAVEGELVLETIYNTDLFDQATVKQWLKHFQRLLEAAVANPEQRLSELPLLDEGERRQIREEWNATEAAYPVDLCLPSLIEAQVEHTPDAVAVAFEAEWITYAELNRRAEQLAHYLQGKGIGTENLVGICLERSVELVIGLLGILKAGAAYVPLDPTYPAERLAYMLADARIEVLVTHSRGLGARDWGLGVGIATLCLDTDWPSIIDPLAPNLSQIPEAERRGQSPVPDPQPQSPSSLAYVIYTSGSTGRPKGAMNTHRGIVNRLWWMQATYHLDSSDRILQKTPASFDVSVWEFFWPLMSGACLVLARPEGHKDPVYLADLIAEQQVTTLHFVPSMLQVFLDQADLATHCASVRRVICSGEALGAGLRDKFFSQLPRRPDSPAPAAELHNLYGPTEAAVDVSAWPCHPEDGFTVPIGRPIANVQLHILDKHFQPVPIGVAGELHIGGIAVGRGYWQRPELTAEKFVPDPFSREPGQRLYQTGDLARWRREGAIEYLGRLDFQVKVRGFRIELGEVEAVLGAHPAVGGAAVVVREDIPGEARLVGYVVSKAEPAPTAVELRDWLRGQLPAYMLPAAYVLLPDLPLTPNGKLDRQALPVPEVDSLALGSRYLAPRTPTEETLVEILAQVLKVEQVGIEDNFFELGGHSLLATQVVSRIRQAFQVELPLRQLFETPTVAGLADSIRRQRRAVLGLGSGSGPRGEAARSGPQLLSYGQQRLWFLDQLEPGSPAYNIPAVIRMQGTLEVIALEASLNEIVQRHETLRTTFQLQAGQPVQVITPELRLTLPLEDLSQRPEAERALQVTEQIQEQTQSPFDLTRGPLIRVALYRLGEAEYLLILVLHHIISDGWSLGVLIREVADAYTAQIQGTHSPLPELPIQYADYAAWQRKWLAPQGEGRLETQLAYWRGRLAGVPMLHLATDRPRSALQPRRGARVKIKLPEMLSQAVRALAQAEGATPFMILLAAFQALLARYSRQTDIAIGTPVANRTRAEVEGLIGFFVNTLVLRTDLSGDPSFRELVGRVREIALGAYAHQDLPFERLVEELQPERSLSSTPLFQVMFVLQNAPLPPLELPGLHLELQASPAGIAKYDLTLMLEETPQDFRGTLEYNADLFDQATLERLVGHFESLLAGASANPNHRLSALPLLTEVEREQLLKRPDNQQWSEALWQGGCLPELVEAQVARTPEAIAVVFEGQQLTYSELNRRADQLAHHLQTLGVGPEVCVGLYLERSPEMVIGILGIHKAGGAYLPLDTAYPPERLAFMLEDSQTPVLLTQSHLLKGPGDWALRTGEHPSVICLDTDWEAITNHPPLATSDQSPPPNPPAPDSLAYVIYTSGSTGQPKGTLVSHANAGRLFESTQAWYNFGADDVWTLFHSHAFDFSVWEIWGALLYGGRLVIVPYWISRSPESFYNLLVNESVTILNQTPSAFRQLIQAESMRDRPEPLHLRHVIFGGEALELHSLQPWLERHGDERPQLVNMYGITETTVHVTYRPLVEADIRSVTGSVIGRPIPDLEIYILDQHLQLVPIGVPGELYISGAGVARGYLNRPELTAERFVPNPFAGMQEKAQGTRSRVLGPWPLALESLGLEPYALRLYRTGDLARYLPNGDIEYLGRIDQQVKIRGFRIELGEIEAALNAHPHIRESLVVARETDLEGGTGKRLVAYLVSESGIPPSPGELRTFLHSQLPEYMLPSAFVWLEAFPLTPNGKVDRQALPATEASRPPGANYLTPRTPTEQRLAEIWAKVLGVESVGVADNFFELGGHSLLATQVVNRVRRTLRVELPLRSLFEAPTLAGLAEIIERADPLTHPRLATIAPVPRTGELPLSYAQQRLWFLDQLTPDSAAYNVPAIVRLNGRLEVKALEASLNEVVRRHEVLRTTFQASGGRPHQVIAPALRLRLEVENLRELSPEARATAVQKHIEAEYNRPFDLAHGPLLRVRLVQESDLEYVLILVLHHIVSDGWSMGVLIQEIAALYTAQLAGEQPALPELLVHYADYAAWQRDWLENEGVLETQLAYWQSRLANVPVLHLPTDRPRPTLHTYAGATLKVKLPEALSTGVNRLAQQAGATTFMVLLAAFQVWLSRYSGQVDFGIGTPVANRTRSEIEGLIGFFVNTLVVRTDLREAGNLNFRELLERVREICLEAYTYQEAPFERVVEAVQPERNLSLSPLFQVMFVLQNAAQPPLELPGAQLELLETGAGTIKFDLTLILNETPEGFSGAVEYNRVLFDEGTIKRWVQHFETLLTAIVAEPEQRVSDLPLLTAAERAQVIEAWNATSTAYPTENCIQEIVERQVRQTPDAMAVVGVADQSPLHLTYAELNRRADQLARHLQRLGVGPEAVVAVCLERSLDMVIGLLAILKAGGAYLPLDPDYPSERLAFMVEDSQAAVVLTVASVQGSGVQVAREQLSATHQPPSAICLDTDWPLISQSAICNLPSAISPDNLAYLIYTSGSTGQPKGVQITHRQLVHSTYARQVYYPEPVDRFLLLSSFAFDSSVAGLFWTLCFGGTLLLPPPGVQREPRSLAELTSSQGVTHLLSLPSLYALLLSESDHPLASLHTIIVAGEPCPSALVERHANLLPEAILYNEYGPTEGTVWSTVYPCPVADAAPVPIGRPIPNVHVYVLDDHLHPVPIGVPGELYLGGAGVARGYLGRPELTAEKFVPNPFTEIRDEGRTTKDEGKDVRPPSREAVLRPSSRLYRTGDLARYRPDGNLEFLGRLDHQVKLRGYRIELGEIESVLRAHPAVKETVVVMREDAPGDQRLAGYIVPRAGETPALTEFRSWLQGRLPDYMLPSMFVLLDTLPRMPNGKVDRKALPAPGGDHLALSHGYVPPRTLTEELMAEIWVEVLHLERVGLSDNFFELGGHSLLATQVIARLYRAFGVELPLRSLFETPTIADLARAVEQRRGAEMTERASPIVPVPRDQILLPSPAQERMWFFDQLAPGNSGQNIAVALRVRGMLNLEGLQWAFNEIVRRHETLRTAFVTVDGQPRLVIETAAYLNVPVIDLRNLSEPERESEARRLAAQEAGRGFELAHGALLRVRAVQLAEADHLLLLTLHHIISDGWSMNVMREEFFALYQAFKQARPTPLPALPIQYADYAAWQRNSSQGGVLDEQLAYWRNQLRGELPVLELPTDRPRPAVMGGGGALQPWQLSATETQALKALGNREGVTPFMLLLAAFQTLLYRYSGQTDIIVGSPVAGRVRVETEHLIGCFINPLPLRGDLSGNPTFRELLQRVREVTLGAYAHQEMPLEVIVQAINVQRQLSHMPLFQTLFVMQNYPASDLNEADLHFEVMEVEIQAAGFDLTLMAWEIGPELHGILGYRAELFEATTVDRMLVHFRRLVLEAITHPDQPLAQLAMLPPEEKHWVLEAWPAGPAEWIAWQPVQRLIESGMTERLDTVALVGREEPGNADWHVTYRELNRRANRLAHYLQKLGVGPETRVGLCLERSPEMIIALLAALKSGAGYVPLDPNSPVERLAAVLADAGASLLLTQERLMTRLASVGIQTVGVDSERIAVEEDREHALDVEVDPDHLAYLIYTSGSTGRPKGVMISHFALARYLQTVMAEYQLTPADRVLQFASISFDASVEEIYPCLASGGTLVLRTDSLLGSARRFLADSRQWELTVLDLPTAYWHELTAGLETDEVSLLAAVRLVIIGGERALPDKFAAWHTRVGDQVRLVNTYGPTEATVVATLAELSGNAASHEVPIGRPLSGVQTYVLDPHLQPTAIGVPGELYISGSGLARGYWDRPELTAEKFIPNPFAGIQAKAPGARTKDKESWPVGLAPGTLRLYRTGDLARWRADGLLEFLGRADEQVKIRGYRIEPGEIEVVLAEHPTVRECTVVAQEHPPGDKRLVAYVVTEPLTEVIPLQLTCELEFEDGQRETRLTEALGLGDECELIVAGAGAGSLTLRLQLPSVAEGYWLRGQIIGQARERTRLRLSLSPDERALLQRALVSLPAMNSLFVRTLRDYLKGKLPSYMLPSAIVRLDKLPRTPSGKVDRQALPAPTSLPAERSPAYVAPRTPSEEKVAGIWAEVLQLERVGVEDNFFEVGGHSLLATQVISRVREALGVEVSLLEMFTEPTVAGVATVVDRAQASGQTPPVPAIVPIERQGRRAKLSARGELLRSEIPQTETKT